MTSNCKTRRKSEERERKREKDITSLCKINFLGSLFIKYNVTSAYRRSLSGRDLACVSHIVIYYD